MAIKLRQKKPQRTQRTQGEWGKKEIATVFLLKGDDEVLLQHRDNIPGLSRANEWVTPGGHRQPEETAEECARREFAEETGYQCVDLRYLTATDDPVGEDLYWLYVYWDVYDGKQEIGCYEGQSVRFVARRDAGDYVIPKVLIECWDRIIEERRSEDKYRQAGQ